VLLCGLCQVLSLAVAGNLMAEELLKKLSHHLRSIAKQAEGDLHWPDKYREHFRVRRAERGSDWADRRRAFTGRQGLLGRACGRVCWRRMSGAERA
jgi:hypothetical protein